MTKNTTNNNEKSRVLFRRAKNRIAGGVNSPVRAFSSVGGEPVFISRGDGAYLFDEDGNDYIDYVCSWGAVIAGHANLQIAAAVETQARKGLGFGAPTALECAFAEQIAAAMPVMESMRAVSSGTEATMSALRLARGFTGRDKIVKFAGCYHGHSDSLLVAAGSGALTFGESGKPSSAGVTEGAAKDTIVLPYNDAQAVADIFAKEGDAVAAVIVEAVAGNMNMIIPASDFLQTLRECCDKYGAVLIVDEVMTGFRLARGGAMEVFNLRADLCCLGKIIGGGLPAAAFGGRADIMKHLAPEGNVYQAGTLSGNPVALAAGLAAVKLTAAEGFYDALSQQTATLAAAFNEAGRASGINLCAQSIGGMFGFYFSPSPPKNLTEAQQCDIKAFRAFHRQMLNCGVYLAPSPFEASFTTTAHTETETEKTIKAATASLSQIAAQKDGKS
ncbi:MAG: glutamate-1-semialdehyde 2,1-aminomutase [Gammaproteobacteria bacterium]